MRSEILKYDLKRFTDGLKPHPQHTAWKAYINKMELRVSILGDTRLNHNTSIKKLERGRDIP